MNSQPANSGDNGPAMETPVFSARLLEWYDRSGRKHLPWQREINPYRVWVSEIMLQQTQVTTVIPYFERFMVSFPDVLALADAEEDDVLAHWSGLGYYARARNLHTAAKTIRDDHGGVFPDDFDAVVALPGIGRSTAGAILSIASGQRHAILDGNVKRVLARHAAVDGWPGSSAVAKALWTLAERRTPETRVNHYTQAIMDLGATLCTRSRPDCPACPVAADCVARVAGTVERYPGKKPKKDKPLKRTTMVLAVDAGAVYLERRPASGIWGGLWSLPEPGADSLGDWCESRFAVVPSDSTRWSTVRHSFSHYDLDIEPVVLRLSGASRKVADGVSARWMPLDAAPPGGMAAPVKRLIDVLRNDFDVPNR